MEGDDEDDDDEVGDEDKTQNLPALVGNNRVYRGWGVLVTNIPHSLYTLLLPTRAGNGAEWD